LERSNVYTVKGKANDRFYKRKCEGDHMRKK
jgi:hypothetical protein